MRKNITHSIIKASMIKKLFSLGSLLSLSLVAAIFVFSFAFVSPVLAATISISNLEELKLVGSGGAYPLDGDYILTQDIDASGTATLNPGGTATVVQTQLGNPENEIQTLEIIATGGSYTLEFDNDGDEDDDIATTGAIDYDAASSTVETALLGLTSIGEGNCSVTGEDGGPYTITFIGDLAATDVSMITTHAVGLVGDSVNRGFNPIGGEMPDDFEDTTGQFTGTFDGQGYKIDGLIINRSDETGLGLFGFNYGEISNLGLTNVAISSGTIIVGGIAGANVGTITNCYTTGTIGAVVISFYIGGLTGCNLGGTITNSYASTTVSGFAFVGGLVGVNGGTITNGYATGAVTGTLSVAGLVGDGADGSVTNCYATGEVTSDNDPVDEDGLIGCGPGTVTASYWDVTTTDQALSTGIDEAIYGKTTANMKKEATFSGWDFATPIWWIDEDTDYPKLQALTSYTLTYSAGDNGSITGDSPQSVLRSADGSAVTATPDTGYSFVEWTDSSTDNPRTDTNITADVSVTATFEATPEEEAEDTAPAVSHSSGSSVSSQVSNLLAMGNTQMANELMTQYPSLFTNQPITPTTPTSGLGISTFVGKNVLIKSRNLKTKSTGPFVKLLQQFLNASGFILAKTGPGSPGHETKMFGALTRGALIKFQKAHNIKPAVGYFGPITRGVIQRLP